MTSTAGDTMRELFDFWDNPPAEYRSMPFWSWNGELKPERLEKQIESMKEAGMGGFFMHSRNGLKTPYLSDEWFRCVGACVEKARELGMKACIYDEDRYPSGDAGGLVTRKHPEFRAVTLRMHSSAIPTGGGTILARFATELDDRRRLKSYRGLSSGSSGEHVCFTQHIEAPCTRHNDSTYIDVFNPVATAEFIRLTHEAYACRFSEDFGTVIPAIFFDEPQYSATLFFDDGSARLPWSPGFPAEFRKRYGYDLLDHLPELVHYRADGDFSRVRYHFYRMCAELFVQNYTRPVADWCSEHNIALTGHILGEADIFQTIVVGACMQHYEHMHWPGIDVLGDQSRELSSAKQASSVADQLGKERVISELYALTGWDWPLEGHKFIGDWHLAAGVNMRCLHLSNYTLAGCGKRDFPASIFHHSPWWSHYRAVEDYFARLGVVLTRGRPVRDVLVLSAMESAWGIFGPGGWKSEVISYVQSRWERVFQSLSGWHYDWDFGDESLMERHARVQGDTLRVGLMSYKVVIVPPSFNIRSGTLDLLRRFRAGGGKVLFVGRLADHVDAEPSDALPAFAGGGPVCGEDRSEIIEAVAKLLPRRLEISENGKEQTCIWAMLRELDEENPSDAACVQLLFVQSHDRCGNHSVRVRVKAIDPVVLWDPMSGLRHEVAFSSLNGFIEFVLELPPTGSALLSLGLDVPQRASAMVPSTIVHSNAIAGPFPVTLSEFNTLPLDFCQYRIGEESFSCHMPSLSAQGHIAKRLGAPLRGAQQPWYYFSVVEPIPLGHCQLRRQFHATHIPGRLLLALEQPLNYHITINGRPCSNTPCGYWLDDDFETIDITALIKLGENELLFDFDYRLDMEPEDMFLVGDFGVERILAAGARAHDNYTLTQPVTQLKLGPWVDQGLDFYSGAVRYAIVIKKPEHGGVRVELPNVACTSLAVIVHGRRFVMPWAPFCADISEALHAGDNEVTIEVVGGRKNILGPLHTPWTPRTHPGKFSTADKDWTDSYLLTNHGLITPVLVHNDL